MESRESAPWVYEYQGTLSWLALPQGMVGWPYTSDISTFPHSLPSKFIFQFLQEVPSEGAEEPNLASSAPQRPPSELQPFLAPVVTNQRVTGPQHFQDVRLIEFDITDSSIR